MKISEKCEEFFRKSLRIGNLTGIKWCRTLYHLCMKNHDRELVSLIGDINLLKKYYFRLEKDFFDLRERINNIPAKEYLFDMQQQLADLIAKRDLTDITYEGRMLRTEEEIRDHEKQLKKLKDNR